MDFFGGLLSAGANLLGGLLNRNAQAKINKENISNANAARGSQIESLVNQAKAAGINPLAVLGQSLPGPAVAVGDSSLGSGVAAAGQDLGRAANALTSQESKSTQLSNELLRAQIANVNADTVAKSAAASRMVVRHGQPGTVSVPLPTPAPHTRDTLPLFQDFRGRHGERVTLLSPEAAQTQFGPGSAAGTGLPVAVGLAAENLNNAAGDLRRDAGPPLVLSGAAWRSMFSDRTVIGY